MSRPKEKRSHLEECHRSLLKDLLRNHRLQKNNLKKPKTEAAVAKGTDTIPWSELPFAEEGTDIIPWSELPFAEENLDQITKLHCKKH